LILAFCLNILDRPCSLGATHLSGGSSGPDSGVQLPKEGWEEGGISTGQLEHHLACTGVCRHLLVEPMRPCDKQRHRKKDISSKYTSGCSASGGALHAQLGVMGARCLHKKIEKVEGSVTL